MALFSMPFLLFSCHFGMGERVSGNGHIVSQDKNLSAFKSVQVSGSMNVHVMQQDRSTVSIRTDENLIPFIEVLTEGDKLIIREKHGFNLDPSKDITVFASAPLFTEIDVSGSGDIFSDNLLSGKEGLNMTVSGSGDIKMNVSLPSVTTKVSGSGSIELKGEATDLNISVSGSGAVKCFDLNSDNVSVSLSGSSDAEVTAHKKLDVSVSGSGTVQYKGDPSVNSKISGSGQVRKSG